MRIHIALFFHLIILVGPVAAAQDSTINKAGRPWSTQHAEIRVATDPDLEPIDFYDAEGRHRGLAADYLKLVGLRSGLTFRVVRSKSWSDSLDALRQRRVDMLASAFASPSRSQFALFSAPYLRLSAALYVRQSDPALTRLDQLAGRKLGVVTDHVWQELIGDAARKINVIPYANVMLALNALNRGEIDAYAGDTISANQAIAQGNWKSRIVLTGPLELESAMGFAVRGDWPELKDILDKALKQITLEEEKSLRERWLKNAASEKINAASADSAPPASHEDEINTALAALARQRTLTAEQRKRAEDLLRQALDDEQHADQMKEQWQTFNQSGAGAAEEAQRLEEALAQDNTAELLAWRSNLPERASVEQLEALLTRERNAWIDARNAVSTLNVELNLQTERPAQIRAELAQARADLAQATVPVEASIVPALLTNALRLRAQAAQRLALTQMARLEVENRSYESRMRVLSVQLRERQRQVSERNQHVLALESLVLDRTGAQVTDTLNRLKNQREELKGQVPILVETADANVVIAEELAATVQRLGEIRTLKEDYANTRADTDQALKNTEERLKIGGVSEAVGLILLAERRKLRPLSVLKHQLAALQTELARTRIHLIDLREQQASLADISVAVSQSLARIQEDVAADATEVHQNLYRLLNSRAELLPRLTEMQTRLASALGETEQELSGLTSVSETLTTMLDSQLLWTPSHSPIDFVWLTQLPRDTVRFLRPQPWLDAVQRAWLRMRMHAWFTSSTLMLLLVLFGLQRRVPKMLEGLASPMRRIRTDRYRYTGAALVLTLLAALPAPLFIWLGGKLWQPEAEVVRPLSDALGIALTNLVLSVYVVSFLRWLCVDNGLAHFHFRWPRARREALNRIAAWFFYLLLPLQFLLTLIFVQADEGIINSVGRSLFVSAACLFAYRAKKELRPGALWTLRDVVLQEPLRARQFALSACVLGAFALIALTVAGYFLTAQDLVEHALQSLALLLVAATLYGIAIRWLVLGARRLALKRMEEKQEAENLTEEAGESGEARPELTEVDTLTIANVSEQTRRLLRAVILAIFGASLLWIWSDIAPALSFLSKFTVWDSTQLIDGTQSALHVTLRDVLASTVVLAFTWIATRNLPGLLEVDLLRRLQLDAPTRYAVTSVLRYLIVIIGTIFGIGLLGVRWSQLQWLIAGLTVGLGFGLQEIFANFISGLIVLFERPVRIGDVVSIAGVEGTVARIRTRATTIIDWDNKEVIVPNKTFITERLANWTLSDTTTRVVIKLGVPYGSDIADVQRMLMEVAAAHPLVLKDPAPSCWMQNFGAATLDFELRFFVAEIGQRNLVRTEVQKGVADALREHGVQMSSPQQMEVWLHQPADSIAVKAK